MKEGSAPEKPPLGDVRLDGCTGAEQVCREAGRGRTQCREQMQASWSLEVSLLLRLVIFLNSWKPFAPLSGDVFQFPVSVETSACSYLLFCRLPGARGTVRLGWKGSGGCGRRPR